MNTQFDADVVQIPTEQVTLEGALGVPAGAQGVVLFVHGSGSSRLSPRNNYVAGVLMEAGFATLLMDLLTKEEDQVYETRFDIDLLTRRVSAATRWLQTQPQMEQLSIGYFGASTGAAAALRAAAEFGPGIRAVVSRGGRPDLAMDLLPRVHAPTLLIVGGYDEAVIRFNQQALERLAGPKELVIVPEATHLFEEPGKLEEVAQVATTWFTRYL